MEHETIVRKVFCVKLRRDGHQARAVEGVGGVNGVLEKGGHRGVLRGGGTRGGGKHPKNNEHNSPLFRLDLLGNCDWEDVIACKRVRRRSSHEALILHIVLVFIDSQNCHILILIYFDPFRLPRTHFRPIWCFS